MKSIDIWMDNMARDVPMDEWDVLVRSDYEEYRELKRQERYNREHPYEDEEDYEEADDEQDD